VVQDDAHPDDVDPEGPEFAVNALRFLVMGRPSPSKEAPVPRVVPGSVGALRQQLQREAAAGPRTLGASNRSKRGSYARS
jgi:hypothetical protein